MTVAVTPTETVEGTVLDTSSVTGCRGPSFIFPRAIDNR